MATEFVHFDELEEELDAILHDMCKEYAKCDPSIRVTNAKMDDISSPFEEKFIDILHKKDMLWDSTVIRFHFMEILAEYDKVDMAVSAKVEDQTPEIGVKALIAEHRIPIMQMLQEFDEGLRS